MSNFSKDPASVRVDFWKPSGKWYSTEAVIFDNYNGEIHTAFAQALHVALWDESVGRHRYSGMLATCLEPYHQHSHPISMMVADVPGVLSAAAERAAERAAGRMAAQLALTAPAGAEEQQ